jgi:hypothetical protein
MILSSKIASQESIRRFRNEAEATSKLDHSGIVPVYDVGELDGQHFLSMAYVTGGSLADLVKSEGPLLPRRAVKLTLSIAEASQFTHSRNVIHRDLKPANILLDEQQPKVTDFGLAKELEVDSGLTASGQIMGTPSYMPPEQASGDMSRVGPLADIYSLGGILYFLLTGTAPFSEANAIETLKLVIDQEPVSPSEYSMAVDADVATICLKCLEKDPAKRYASATELAAELHRYLNGETIHARPVGVVERQWRWVRRYPARAALEISSLLVLVASAVIGVGYAYQSELEKKNRQVTTSNKLLSEAEKSKQKALTKQQAQAAMLLMARGRFRDAFIGLGELTKANEELAHMRREGDPGEFAGDVKLREAEYTIRAKSAAASVELYREALALGLPPAEEEYVRGMLAETSPLALARFRKAVQLDPFNHSAHGALTTLLTTTWRRTCFQRPLSFG